jgi:hypothetical protein
MTALFRFLAVAVFATAFNQGAFAQGVPGVLRVSAIPDEAPTELQRKFKPLGEYLARKTGMKVVFTPVTDYAAVVESLATDKLDLAWLGGFTFVQAKLRTNGKAIPIVQRAEDEKFTSKFIVPIGSSAKTLADLKGKTFGTSDAAIFPVAGGDRSRQGFQERGVFRRARRDGGLCGQRQGRSRRAQCVGVGEAGEGKKSQRTEGEGAGDDAAFLRLQLDRAR